MAKTYTHEQVEYGAHGRKWKFTAPKYEYSTPIMPGGAETAHKVARVINGAVKRCGELDNLGRSNIHTILTKARQAHANAEPKSRRVH